MTGGKINILVIEDNPGDARMIFEMLKEKKEREYETEWVDRLSSGLDYLSKMKADIVLLDLGLPDSQGLDTLDKLQNLDHQMPIVIMTGLADEMVGMTAVGRGAQDYLVKGMVGGKEIWHAIIYTLERKRIETRLRDSEQRYRLLIENIPVGVSVVICGKIVYTNQWLRLITGYSHEELTSIDGFGLIHPEDRELVKQIYIDRMELKETQNSYSFRVITKEGDIRWLERKSMVILWNNDKAVLVLDQDITDRKQSEAKVKEIETLKLTNQVKSELLANVSHELRTPLASIKGFVESLLETDVNWTRDQQVDFLTSANTEIDRLTFLIRDLLDMSRIDSGKMALNKRLILASEIMESVSGILTTMTLNHRLIIEVLADLPPVMADKVRIGQVVTNLVENATKFSSEKSEIRIEVGLQDNYVVVNVEDCGIGMTSEVVGSLFNRFYQAKQAVMGKTRGSGLGLAICKGIVEAHGGRIWAESKEGKGSRFSFSIPVSADRLIS